MIVAFVHAYLAAGYALKGEIERDRAELAEAQELSKMYSSLASVKKSTSYDAPKIRALAEANYFPGLHRAGSDHAPSAHRGRVRFYLSGPPAAGRASYPWPRRSRFDHRERLARCR
jgi:hypothetical protein